MLLLLDLRGNLLLLLTISGLISSSYGQPTYNYHFCLGSNNTNNTTNTTYQSNLSDFLGSLSSTAAISTFYKNTSNGIYDLYLCRGDITINACHYCVNSMTQEIQKRCPSNQAVIIWYDECMLCYSDTNFFGMEETSPSVFAWNLQKNNNTSPTEINVETFALMYALVRDAPNKEMMYDADESIASNGNGSQNRYGLVQCSRDLTSDECKNCLGQLMDKMMKCCQGRIGWCILVPSCYLRYEEYPFFPQSLAPSVPPAQPLPNNEGQSNWKGRNKHNKDYNYQYICLCSGASSHWFLSLPFTWREENTNGSGKQSINSIEH